MSSLSEALRLYQDGQYEEAAKRFRILTEFEPDNPQPWIYYAAALGQQGRWGQAADAYRRVVDLLPEEVTAYCDLAEALLQAGRLDQAEEAVQMVLTLAPQHPLAADLKRRLAAASPKPAAPAPRSVPTPRAEPEPPAPAAVPELVAGERAPRVRRRWRPNRLAVLLTVLAVLLGVVIVRLAALPTARWQPLRDAASMLDSAESQRAALARQPGEDLQQVGRIRELLSGAEALLFPATGLSATADAAYLRGRLYWDRDRDGLSARNELLEALSRLAALPPGQRQPLGLTTAQLDAAICRLLARIELETPGGSLERAAQWAAKAKVAAPGREDAALASALAAARARR